MKNEILANINNPFELERLYQSDKLAFKNSFSLLKENELANQPITQFWNARLDYTPQNLEYNKHELYFVLLMSVLIGFIVKIPKIFTINEELYFSRNVGFIVFPILIAYFSWRNKFSIKQIAIYALFLSVACIYINLLPPNFSSYTVILSCIHLPFILWAIFGVSFTNNRLHDIQKSISFLKFNGELVIISAIILMAGVVLSAITLGLFEAANFEIKTFYFENVALMGLATTPLVGTFLIRNNPQLVNKVSPIIAKVFSPLVFIMLLVYLIALISAHQDLYNDRNYLLIFNILLLGVLALILFSVVESSSKSFNKFNTYIITMLAVITIILNLFALSAIIFRISTWGFSPNRLAVFGSNVLMLSNLLWVCLKLFKVIKHSNKPFEIEKTIVQFLPVYFVWACLVCFGFPFIFSV